MSSSKKTKQALISSLISMALCIVTLAAATYAWFADGVVSGSNQIIAGSLDAGLKYAAVNLNGSDNAISWIDVSAGTDIFGGMSFAPGSAYVTYFEVSNSGSLPLKYDLALIKTQETTGTNGEKLSDQLVFTLIELNGKPETAYTKEEAITAAGSTPGFDQGTTKLTKTLESGENAKHYYALVIYMPDNETAYTTTRQSLGLNMKLIATQVTYESDPSTP